MDWSSSVGVVARASPLADFEPTNAEPHDARRPLRVAVTSAFVSSSAVSSSSSSLSSSPSSPPVAAAAAAAAAAVVFAIDDVLSAEECLALIAVGESLGFGEAPICACGNVREDASATARVNASLRHHKRAAAMDAALCSLLLGRLRHCIPERLADGGLLKGLNPLVRWLRYDCGDFVAVHKDGAYLAPSGERSALTLLVYLTNEGARGGGGETAFYASWKDADARDDRALLAPRAGRACLMPQNILHEGRKVHTQSAKYVLRTEVMYSPAPLPPGRDPASPEG